MVQDRAIFAMATNRKSHMVYRINDLERPLTWFSRSRHSLTLNILQTAIDTAIVTIEGEQETAPKLSNGTNFNDFE